MDETNGKSPVSACAFTPGERSLPPEVEEELKRKVAAAEHPREMAVDVMYALQNHYGYFSDTALTHACDILGMTHVELEELATFYDYIYREPVGKYVIHVCDGVVCYLRHDDAFFRALCETLGVGLGETTADRLFTILPTACIGDCHKAPSMLINGVFYGPVTPEMVPGIIADLRKRAEEDIEVMCR